MDLKEFAVELGLPPKWVDEMMEMSKEELVEQLIMASASLANAMIIIGKGDIEEQEINNLHMFQYRIDDSVN
jgi:hypothetical protein